MEYRPKSSVRLELAVSAVVFGCFAAGTLWYTFAILMVPETSAYLIALFVGLSVIEVLIALRCLWLLLFLRYSCLLVNADQIVLVEGRRRRSLAFRDVNTAKWHPHFKYGSLSLRGKSTKIFVVFTTYSGRDRGALIWSLRERVPRASQEGWERFRSVHQDWLSEDRNTGDEV